MARRGARQVLGPQAGTASDAWRQAMAAARPEEAPASRAWEPDEIWVEEGAAEAADAGAAAPAGAASGNRPPPSGPLRPAAGHRFNVPEPVVQEMAASAGAQRGAKLASRLADATHAYEHDRYQDAVRMLRSLAIEVPAAPAVRELQGLALYRMGRWSAAAKELEVYRSLSGSYDQHPVLADCYRAMRRFSAAEELWEELRRASPSAEVVAEGRIVAAGCRADQGDLPGAIRTLERADRHLRRPERHHLRQWYALADFYERAGDLPRARELFGRIVAAHPGAYDARWRLRQLG